MRVVIAGGGALAEALAARFAAARVEVIDWLADMDEAVGPHAHSRHADAAIEVSVTAGQRKRHRLERLDALLPDTAPLLACCHAASATDLAAGLRHGNRVVGFALLPPWEQRTTVECARALQTSADAAVAAAAVWRAIDLEPVWVADSVGLVLPRLVACLANEAAFALMEGTATAADIDRAMELGTRYPRGPLAWGELVGWADVVATLDGLAAEQGEDRYRAAPLLRRFAAAGRPLPATWPVEAAP